LQGVDIDGDSTVENTELHLKQLTMNVGWTDNENQAQSVVLNSMITYTDSFKVASYATGGSGERPLAPPGRDSATEGPGVPGTITPGTLDEEGDPNDTTDDIYYGTDSNGNLVVYRSSPTANNVELTVYGGKIIKFSGTIYYDSSTPYVRATSPSFCAFFEMSKAECGITFNGSQINCGRYACYAGGDCSNGGDGCPVSQDALDALPDDLNGGWYGKVGDFFPGLANAQQYPTICMGDSIDVAARLYVTERDIGDPVVVDEVIVSTGTEREGINTSFECQDVLISEPNDSACSGMLEELIVDYGIKVNPNAVPNEIADHQVIRDLGLNDTNVVLAATNNSVDNGVFPNFCGDEITTPPSTPQDYTCTCNWNKRDSYVESVIGVRSDGEEETGCCRIVADEDYSEGCNDYIPSPIPASLKNFTYSCTSNP
jgi:hypothetical protein